MSSQQDTIVAIATPPGPGAIGVLRLSGPGAVRLAERCFRPLGHKGLRDRPPRTLVYGSLLDRDGVVIDQALCTVSYGPHSYTGEDTAEFQCHGAPQVLSLGLEALCALGARLAGPGEFTRRAFLNGKMDLAQAEAVGDLLEATSREGVRQAAGQLARGIPCALVGQPNVGKSSLLNALAGFERAIVTDIPGTTRDTVEANVELGGLPLRLIDTAGLRDSDDPVERMGVERSRAAMEQAELILVLWDSSARVTGEEVALLERAVELAPTILVWTKGDLPTAPIPVLELPEGLQVVELSARTGEGLDRLEEAVAALFPRESGTPYGQMLTNQRQEEATGRARAAVHRAREALEAGVTPDALLTDVEEALAALGELTGQSVREDITDRIFSRFCVGK